MPCRPIIYRSIIYRLTKPLGMEGLILVIARNILSVYRDHLEFPFYPILRSTAISMPLVHEGITPRVMSEYRGVQWADSESTPLAKWLYVIPTFRPSEIETCGCREKHRFLFIYPDKKLGRGEVFWSYFFSMPPLC